MAAHVVLVAGTKGGTSKSTTAVNLAVFAAHEGAKVMLIDTDTAQMSSDSWCDRRENPEINAEALPKIYHVRMTGKGVHQGILDMSELYDVIIVDAGGKDALEMRLAMRAADVLVTPMQPTQFDLETLPLMDELVNDARINNPDLRVLSVISRAEEGKSRKEIMEAREMFKEFPTFQPIDIAISNRKAYQSVVSSGRGVIEYRDSVARAEIQLLAAEVFNG